MIIAGIILIILAIIIFYYSLNDEDENYSFIPPIKLFSSIFVIFAGIIFICVGSANLKSKEKEIKNVEYYNIKSTVIIENNIPTDTIYTIYYKKK